MATTVHASSLESVTHIASNPPTNLNIPIEGPDFPLVLYIARVPGSRDVFLTPMKPRDRVVTAQDVQSALFFIHVNSAKDFEEPLQRLTEGDEDVGWTPSLPPRPAVTDVLPPYPGSQPGTESHPGQPRASKRDATTRKPLVRKAVPSGFAHGESRPSALPSLPPRPLPALPNETGHGTPSLHKENMRLLRHADHTRMENPYDQTYPAGEDTWTDPSIRPVEDTLTLIRRNPSTHEQWNVASIHDPPLHEVSSAALHNTGSTARSRKSGTPIYLDITNPAYVQFLHDDQGSSHGQTPLGSSPHGLMSSDTFRRRLYMPASRHGVQEDSFAHTRNGSDVSSGDPQHSHRPMRNSVDMSVLSAASERRSKGYTFDSPWNSRCEFHTGATGNNLKCRHVVNGGRSEEVSELRFNLPSTSSARGASGPTGNSEKRGSYMHRLHQRMRSTDATAEPKPLGQRTPTLVLDEDERVDLSLGQERAGGGFAGRQAKLGKLIIEPEGFKMLDLLVAANIGLWWRAYER